MNLIKERKQNYVNKNIFNQSDQYALLLQAYSKQPINMNLFNNSISHYITKYTNNNISEDFILCLYIRLLYLTKQNNCPEHSIIFDKINEIMKTHRFWLEKKESENCYWSENHMISYLSVWYLWNLMNNIDNTKILSLLTSYMNSKINYSFFEFYSQVYNSYTLNALLNIYDFTNNISLQKLASNCINILFKQFSEVIINNGSLFCAAGRTYDRYKVSCKNHNHNKLMHLLTGLNNENDISPLGTFFATSSYNEPVNVTNFYKDYDKIYILNNNIDFDTTFSSLDNYDKTMFEWSSGNYFNKKFVDDTVKLLDDYELWNHKHFKMEQYSTILSLAPKKILVSTTDSFTAFTEGSDLRNATYHIYNNGNYCLTSVENYNRGKMGAQQCTWIANVNGVSVFTQSGKISGVGDLKEVISNTHLPCIKQIKNIAMIVYQPYEMLKTSLVKLDMNVYLFWNSSEFDEEYRMTQNKWIFGRKNNAYIAIFSTSMKEDSNKNIYNNDSDKQGWITILGDNTQYIDFKNFYNDIINNAKIEFSMKGTKNILNILKPSKTYYYGKITYKNISFDMKW